MGELVDRVVRTVRDGFQDLLMIDRVNLVAVGVILSVVVQLVGPHSVPDRIEFERSDLLHRPIDDRWRFDLWHCVKHAMDRILTTYLHARDIRFRPHRLEHELRFIAESETVRQVSV